MSLSLFGMLGEFLMALMSGRLWWKSKVICNGDRMLHLISLA